MNGFNYENTETKIQQGGKIVRKVSIKKGRGYKSVTKYHKGKKQYTIKKPIHKTHIQLIKRGKFIPGLFKDCRGCKTKKRGGDITNNNERDIEAGIVEKEQQQEFIKSVPADPERFKRYEEQMIRESLKPVPSGKAFEVFSKPNPEEREILEGENMMSEDILYKHPYDREELVIFRGGKTRRRGRRGRKGGEADIQPVDNQRQRMLSELQNLMRQNQQNSQRYQELDDRLYAIEQMTQEERSRHTSEEEDLQRQMDEIADINNQLQNRFEQTRTEYFRRYGTPETQAIIN